jgi:hypothetical protein
MRPFEADDLGPGEEGQHRAPERDQPLAQRAGHVAGHQALAHPRARRLDRGRQQPALVAEVVVDRHLGNAGVGGDGLDRGRLVAVREKGARRRLDDRLALAQVGWAARSDGRSTGQRGT